MKTDDTRVMKRWIVPLALSLAAGLAACSNEGRAKNPSNTPTDGTALTQTDVDQILVGAVSQASSINRPAVVAVTDRQGEVLGVFVMQGRDVNSDGTIDAPSESDIQGAISKAATASAFQSAGEAFTTRTAYFIVQGHYPPNVVNSAGGPLFGVQDSGMPSSDSHIVAYDQNGNACGTGISGVFGGIPLYKNGSPVGGIGVSTVAVLTTQTSAAEQTPSLTLVTPVQNEMDESIARAGAGVTYGTPSIIQATNVFVDGIQFPFFGNTVPVFASPIAGTAASIASSIGTLDARFPVRASPFAESSVGAQYGVVPSARFQGRVVARASSVFSGTFTNVDRPLSVTFDPATYKFLNVPLAAIATNTQPTFGGSTGELRFSIIDSVEPPPAQGGLTSAEVSQLIDLAAGNARGSIAGIRLPRGSSVTVHIAVVDARGNILGVFRMADGTLFSFDIAVQKARTAAFFSSDGSNGIPGCAISARAIGFVSQPFFPPGIAGTEPGPLVRLRDLLNRGKVTREPLPSLTLLQPPPSAPSDGTTDEDGITGGFQRFNDFNGAAPAELASVRALVAATGGFSILADRPDVGFIAPGLQTGIMTFPGGLPIYKNGKLVGAIGVSGDGVDEDDAACFAALTLFPPPPGIRCDEVPEGVFDTVVRAKVDTIVAALQAHPDPRIKNVYGQLMNSERARIDDRFSRGLGNVRIPFVKLPRNPTEF